MDHFCCQWEQCHSSQSVPIGFLQHLWIAPDITGRSNLATDRVKEEQNTRAGWKLAGVLAIDWGVRSSTAFTSRFDSESILHCCCWHTGWSWSRQAVCVIALQLFSPISVSHKQTTGPVLHGGHFFQLLLWICTHPLQV